MAELKWDTPGERRYQTGVDRGVLYRHDAPPVVWNGLVGVEDSLSSELKSYFLDGVKYLESLSPGDFQGKLKAFTYPDEFDEVNGISILAPGLSLYEQPPKSFSLSYRTRLGDDVNGTDLGYKIHILYNLLANPETNSFNTFSEGGGQPITFGWSITGTPPSINKFRSTVHIVINSLTTPIDVLALIEARLYGTATSVPSLPTIQEVAEYFGYLGALLIIDNGDGSWTALDESDTYINMLDETTFEIVGADAVLVGDIYTISSTNVGGGL